MRKPFTTDGCSGGYSAFVRGAFGVRSRLFPYCRCHDYLYRRGGSREDRIEADRAFRRNVLDFARRSHLTSRWFFFLWAHVSYILVRLFGGPRWPFPWRWGYGDDEERGYR